MSMHDYAIQEFRKLEKQIFNDNRKLEALRLVIKEYATEEFPGTEKMNQIIFECVQKNNGAATLDQIADCVMDHQITLPRSKLSLYLTKHGQIKYDREQKKWISLPNPNGNL